MRNVLRAEPEMEQGPQTVFFQIANGNACAGNVQRYCRPILDQGDFAVLACLQQHREKLTATCKKVLADHGQ
jgi:hypothetical protein